VQLVLRPKVCEIPVLDNAHGLCMLKTGNLLPFLRRIDNQDLLFFGPGFSCALVWAVPVVLNPMQPNHKISVPEPERMLQSDKGFHEIL